MRNVKDPRQGTLIDVFQGVIGKTGLRLIAEGWQGVFRHIILQELPVLRLGADLDEFLGRPSAELHAMCGLLLIREFRDWTVPEAHQAIVLHSDVQYALNLEPGYDISQRTLERYLARLQEDDGLAAELMRLVTDRLVRQMELNVSKQRLDSTHVYSDMASFGRTRLMGVAVKRFLAQVLRHHPADYAALPDEFRSRYEQSAQRLFGESKTTEARRQNQQQAAEDLQWIVGQFANHVVIQEWPTYLQLVKLFHQQCEVIEERIVVRKQTGGDVIQNPSDPDATYSGCKGQGYQVQLSETCHPDNEQQLILAALPQTAVEQDAQAMQPVLDDLSERGHLPNTMACDCGYGSDDNVQAAQALEVTLISPVPGGAEFDANAVGIEQFVMDPETHTVIACPAGHAPLKSTYNADSDRVAVTMPLVLCAGCPLAALCPAVMKKTSAKVYFTMNEHRAGQRRRHEQTSEFRTAYAPRAGIESTNSGLKRREGMGQLRVRGKPAVNAAILLKVAGWNILRASEAQKVRAYVREKMAREGRGRSLPGTWGLCVASWRTLRMTWTTLRREIPLPSRQPARPTFVTGIEAASAA